MSPKNDDKELHEQLRKNNKMIVPIQSDIIEATKNLGKGEIEVPKEIIEIEGLIFSRGKFNAQFFRGLRKNYVVPNWVEKMLNPRSEGVISLGHSSWFINSNYRDWIAFGGIDCFSEGIVTGKGLVIPQIDGWGLLAGAIIKNKPFYITRDGESLLQMQQTFLPISVHHWKIMGEEFFQEVYGGKSGKSEVGVLVLTKKSQNKEINLIISIRPFNQEGISLIKSICYNSKDNSIMINKELAFRLSEKPAKIAKANYHHNGDSAVKIKDIAKEIDDDQEISINCDVGLANMTFIFPEGIDKIEIYFRMTKEPLDAPPVIANIIQDWREKLSLGMSLETGHLEIDRLFNSSLANLLLLTDPGTITPGPTIYHRFWCRDAAYLINALDKAGYHNDTREALNQFIKRQRKDGFYYSHEGEYDSNGEGIWVLAEHAKLTKDVFWLEKVFDSIEKAAEWLILTRKKEKEIDSTNEDLVKRLLPPGYSAEHLGPCDFFYWDNFWGVAGLREATECAKILDHEKFQYLEKEYLEYKQDLLASLELIFKKYKFLPVGPFRECDSAMIANMVAWHPTKVLDWRNEMLLKTAETIYQNFTINGGFFHEVAWNCFGTYLTMHLAQVYAAQNNQKIVSEIMDWLVKYQTCPMGWAEGISPQTMQGGMGDSPHGWASADWLLLIRNMFANESIDGNLVLLNGIPMKLLHKGIKGRRIRTYYGELNFECKIIQDTMNLKFANQLSIPNIFIRTPKMVTKVTTDKGDDAEIVESQCVKVNKSIKEVKIKME